MIKDKLKVACVTMNSRQHKAENIEQAEHYLQEAGARGADWVVLPEMFPFMGSYDELYAAAELAQGPLSQRLQRLAKQYKMTVFAGMPEIPDHRVQSHEEGKVYNSLFVFGPEGSTLGVYRKIHLFHLEFGAHTRSESTGFLAGNKVFTLRHQGWNVACAICYDLRFPEMFVALNNQLVFDALILPSAFTEVTGQAHWELLLRARATEYQCYVLAADQTGTHIEPKKSFGHSMIVDPWGQVIAQTAAEPGLAFAEISRDHLTQIRSRIPMQSNRRRDLF
jgi:predicted amidohydrolase